MILYNVIILIINKNLPDISNVLKTLHKLNYIRTIELAINIDQYSYSSIHNINFRIKKHI